MISRRIVISGTGCALADFLYNGISFNSPGFKKLLSEKNGDGGLSPGKLVFTEELEKYGGQPYPILINEILGNRTPDAFNVGGPSVVSLIHAAQLLNKNDFEVKFFGMAGRDETAEKMFKIISQTPLNIENYRSESDQATPFTDVLSDPDHDFGHGERTFINNIGAAGDYSPDHLSAEFFDSHIVCFGGTALVPQIHDNLTLLLGKAHQNNCITLVNTVFDFRNEKNKPGQPWPLVSNFESFKLIDVLVMDCTEALSISGQKTIDEAAGFFASSGVSSFIITNGAQELIYWSGGGLFEKTGIQKAPVSKTVAHELQENPHLKGDTTGCGDNFAGGIIASIGWQLSNKQKGDLKLVEALSWGIASGGFCCFTVGGTYLEKRDGEKKEKVQEIQKEYINQIGL